MGGAESEGWSFGSHPAIPKGHPIKNEAQAGLNMTMTILRLDPKRT